MRNIHNKTTWHFFITSVLILALAVFSAEKVCAQRDSLPYAADGVHPLVGKKAPDFTLKDVNGKEVKLSDFKDKVVLLSFFGTWSKLSRKQILHLKKLHNQHHKSGLVLIGITVKKNSEKLKQFALEQRLPYPILIGNRKTFKKYKVGGVLDTYYLDVEGKVSVRDVGFKPGAEKKMEARIKKLLKLVPEQRTSIQRYLEEGKGRHTGRLTDIGGFRTAHGKSIKRGFIYRASFQPYTLPDQETIRQFKLVIDYRLDDESPLQRNAFRKLNGTKMIRLPFWAYPTRQEAAEHWDTERPEIFAEIIRKCPQEIRQTFSLLSDEDNYPVLYFCSYGIHRATIISAILYLALGVPEETILDATSLRLMLKTVFREINKSGGITGYLKRIGVSNEEITAFQKIMLER